ncbi:MAG TPA: glycosyltransferase, partial [Saprospiraceae bacterium]|nr:glycosyltransferase [Saprospiraceae bacterium]
TCAGRIFGADAPEQTLSAIELVIGEDASPDGTLRICQHYQALHPDKIRLMTGEKNMGFSWNFARTLWATRGEYIALLEGDDYWTDPLKLQKQVDFLRKSPDFNLHFHNAHLLKQGAIDGQVYPAGRKETITISDVLQHDYTQTCTVMIRAYPLRAIPEAACFDWVFNDITLFALALSDGSKGQYSPELMAAYRVHEGGVWSMASLRRKYSMSRSAEDILISKYGTRPTLRRLIAKREMQFYYYYSKEMLKHGELRLLAGTLGRLVLWSLKRWL